MNRSLTILMLLGAAAGFAGCGGSSGNALTLVPVQGIVTHQGKPLGNAGVIFLPVAPTPGRGGTAKTDAAGKYQLAQSDGAKGVPAGKYRVVISKLVNPDGTDFTGAAGAPMDTNARELLPKAASDPQATELTAEVSASGGTIDFPLK